MRTYDFTAHQITDMAQRYINGESSTAIAEDYGCSGQTIARVLKEHGYWDADQHKHNGKPRYYFTARQIADMAERHVNGATAKNIGAHYGCSGQTIVALLKKGGYWDESLRHKAQATSDYHQEIKDRYLAGEGLRTLGRDYGCSPANIRWILLKQDVKLRSVGRAPTPPDTLEWIRQQREAGASHQKIADALGFTKQHIIGVCRQLGLPRDPRMSGPEHHAWKGGRYVDGNGYVQVWIDPQDPMSSMATATGHVPEHRLVMARSLGRPLTDSETVHHKNSKDKTNNDLSNLQLRWGNHGKGFAMKCLDCGSHNLGFDDLI